MAAVPATIAALFYINDSHPPPGGRTTVFAPEANEIKLKYVQRIATGQWVIAFNQTIDPQQYIAFVTTNGMHETRRTYAYGVVINISPTQMLIETYGREHLAVDSNAPWETSNTSFTVMMLQIPPGIGLSSPVLEPGEPHP
jgi:hypothetical protein